MFNRQSTASARDIDGDRQPTAPLPSSVATLKLAATSGVAETSAPALLSPALASAANDTIKPVTVDSVERSTPRSHVSIIGNDLTIMGERLVIITKGTLQIDGEVMGDLHGAEVIVGESGKVTGTICADSVAVHGKVSGTIKGRHVQLMDKCLVEGDVHHQSIAISAGAHFDGRVRRPKNASELSPNLDPKHHARTQAVGG
jgi:cytoskeletal protein CcmA (bactofilin family)